MSTPFGKRLQEMREGRFAQRRLEEQEERAQRQQFDREEEPDRMPVGNFDGRLDPTLRWGGSSPYSFLQELPPAPPAPGFQYLQSNLIAQAKAPRPRTWSVLMQATFDQTSEWSGSAGSAWQIVMRLLCGAGQANIILEKYFTGNPAVGFLAAGDATPQPPFATLVGYWEAVPAQEIDAQVLMFGNQSGSPAPFTGQVSAIIAPYYPVKHHEEHHHHGH